MCCALGLIPDGASHFGSYTCDLSSLPCPPGMRENHTRCVKIKYCSVRMGHVCVAPGHWLHACHYGSVWREMEGDGRSSATGTSLAALIVSASSVAMASGTPDGFVPSGDGFSEGADILVRKEGTAAIRLITYLSRLCNQTQPQSTRLFFLSHRVAVI